MKQLQNIKMLHKIISSIPRWRERLREHSERVPTSDANYVRDAHENKNIM